MITSKIQQLLIASLVILSIGLGGYTIKTYLEATSLRSEVSTLTSALDKSKKAIHELTEDIMVIEDNAAKLDASIQIYVDQLEEDNKSISNLKRKLANVEHKETNQCLNGVLVPDSILSELYTED